MNVTSNSNSPISDMRQLAKDLHHVDLDLISSDFPLIEKLPVDEQYKELSTLCNHKVSIHPEWFLLSGRIRMKGLKLSIPATFSACTNLEQDYLSRDYVNFVNKYAAILDDMIKEERDYTYDIFSVETCAKSYLHKIDSRVIESPQYMYLRMAVAKWFPCDANGDNLRSNMLKQIEAFKKQAKGTPLEDKCDYLKQFLPKRKRFTEEDELKSLPIIRSTYELLSTKCISHASPTAFNEGRPVCPDIFNDDDETYDNLEQTKSSDFSQLGSCFVGDVPDTIEGLTKWWEYTATVSKQSGGWGQNFSKIRHSEIGHSGNATAGIVPWIGITGKILSSVDQGGKRKGSGAMYIRDYHLDIFEFLDMRKSTGPEEARSRETFYGLCISDEFMRRVIHDQDWTLMCPNKTNGLDEFWGVKFEEKYKHLEKAIPTSSKSGIIYKRTIKARRLWERIYLSHVETGLPYIFFIDNTNKASNHSNLGTTKLSNLCGEITLYTDEDHISSCNLAAVVLDSCVEEKDGKPFYNREKLKLYTKVLVRNLNQVIDRTHYPHNIPQIRYANMRNRPLGIGVIGLADTFAKMDIAWDSPQARELNEDIFETMYYAAVSESAKLARIHGSYETFEGSPASKGVFQFEMRGFKPRANSIYPWERLRAKMRCGMRNSTELALMPTASSAGLLGKTECFEPPSFLVFTRRVLSGEFVITNKYLVDDLQKLGLWNTETLKILWGGGGPLNLIKEDMHPSVKFRLRFLGNKYNTAYKLSQKVLSDLDLDRGKYVSQSTSWNIFMEDISYQKMTSLLVDRWRRGAKTGCYYVRQTAKVNPTNFSLASLAIPNKESTEEKVCVACVL